MRTVPPMRVRVAFVLLCAALVGATSSSVQIILRTNTMCDFFSAMLGR